MLIILGTVRLPPENLYEARAAMQEMIEESRAEEGCVTYSYAEDVIEPGLVRVTEIWRDREALDAHFASDHLAEWRANWDRLGVHDRDLQLFEAKSGQPV
ncbi:putative quinol monooxygenase [Parerythrobacter jejuensis]|uniref:Antibiotic biosynthesis monooxygenase n=1 Tax=Parerythrobacter jejuensis TaxID=795812 RepID=A0A845AXR1_9SPHN|nr:putative quinol monooxygenase [Parerythrobacter jejuensis]MXP31213.1 antibiotic biosynthesis monooxygenase [Parerythrobacter jejuensis]MXP33973.1 antibiotic biosynthesis monooxygenase [Parerythrobacter jejuensis]